MKQSVTNELMVSRMPLALSRQQIKERAAAMFTKKAHPGRTDSYKFVDTEVVVKHLQKLGFIPFDANQLNFRSENDPNNGFQFHGVSMYHPNLVIVNEQTGLVDKVFEVVVTNSYNGYSKCNVHCSFHRVSTNIDLLAMSDDFAETVRGGTKEELDGLFNSISNHFLDMVLEINRLKRVNLTQEQKVKLAEALCKIRHGLEDDEELGYDPKFILEPMHDIDKDKDNAWVTYCIIQEKLVKGFTFPKEDGERVGRKIRSVNHFELSIKLNKAMFGFVKKHC